MISTKKIKKIILFILFIIIFGAACIFALTGVSAAEITESTETTDTETTDTETTDTETTDTTDTESSGVEITDADIDAVSELIDSVGDLGNPENAADSVNIIILLTIIALAPSILVLMTGFTRILIVLSFVRNALGLQQTPPNQVLVGIALFLTIFLMSPIFVQINDEALQPYINEEISMDEAFTAGMAPVRGFMMSQVNREDINTFLNLADRPVPEEFDDIGTEVLIPAFIMGEIKRAFIMGFSIYVPFLIIDLVVASTLMSLGMMMLPPAMVAMPFKLILFIVFDGWGLITTMIMGSFYA